MNQENDAAIDKLLAALKCATPPQGMETRIAQRLAQHCASAPPPQSHWPIPPLAIGPVNAFWRGAASGAAFALCAVALALVALRGFLTSPHPQPSTATTARNATRPIVPVKALATNLPAATSTLPCSIPAVVQSTRVAAQPHSRNLLAQSRSESEAPSHPAPALPLTAEERDLVRIARTADPKQLATLNPDTQSKLLAQQAADFDKFFAPPPAPPATANQE